MAEKLMPMDELEDYVFGRLKPAASHQLEKQLIHDPELREQARELEEGVLALAMTAPQLRPPPESWAKIQAGVARERQYRILWLTLPYWPFHGWPLAGGLAMAVFLYIAAVHVTSPEQMATRSNAVTKQINKKNTPPPLPEAPRVAARESSKAVSNAVTSDKKMPRLTYIPAQNAVPVKNRAVINTATVQRPGSMSASRQSAALQYAGMLELVTLALAEGTGSKSPSSPTNSSATSETPGPQDFQVSQTSTNLPGPRSSNSTNSAASQEQAKSANQIQVDYVQLPNPAEAVFLSPLGWNMGLGAGWSTTSASAFSFSTSGLVSMYPHGDDLWMFAPGGIGLMVWAEDTEGYPILLGNISSGTNPMVIYIQNAGIGMGVLYEVTATGTNIPATSP